MKTNEIEIKKTLGKGEAADILTQLAGCFEKGRLVLARDEQFVALAPGEAVGIEIEAAQKKDKEKLMIKMVWRTTEPEHQDGQLKILSDEPEPPETEADTDA